MPIIPDNGEKKEAHKPKCRICGKHCGCFIRYKEYFMPRKEPRYVKWMVSNAKWKEDLKYYNFHLKNVFDSKCEVDTRPPRLDIMYYLQANKIHRDDERIYEIEKENKKLFKRIIEINRKGGYTDNINANAFMNVSQWRKNQLKMLEIDKENNRVHRTICDCDPYYPRKYHISEWKLFRNRMKISCKFPMNIFKKTNLDDILKAQPTISKGLDYSTGRPECFIEFQVEKGEYLGKIIVQLYNDHVPVTVQNFLEIIRGDCDLTYKNCPVHRIVKDRFMETGDITKGTGTGGFSIYGENFDEEGHRLKHTKAGVLSMVRVGNQKNNSKFCITFMDMPEWDKKNVVFWKSYFRGESIDQNKCLWAKYRKTAKKNIYFKL